MQLPLLFFTIAFVCTLCSASIVSTELPIPPNCTYYNVSTNLNTTFTNLSSIPLNNQTESCIVISIYNGTYNASENMINITIPGNLTHLYLQGVNSEVFFSNFSKNESWICISNIPNIQISNISFNGSMTNQTKIGTPISISNALITNILSVVCDSFMVDTEGGCLSFFNISSFTVSDSRFSHSSSTQGGALSLNEVSGSILRSNFTENSADTNAGAVSIVLSNIIIQDSLFSANSALSGNGGGALYSLQSSISVSGSFFSENEAQQSFGGAVFSDLTSLDTQFNSSNNYFFSNYAGLTGGDIQLHTLLFPNFTFGYFDSCNFSSSVSYSSGGSLAFSFDDTFSPPSESSVPNLLITNSIYHKSQTVNYGPAIYFDFKDNQNITTFLNQTLGIIVSTTNVSFINCSQSDPNILLVPVALEFSTPTNVVTNGSVIGQIFSHTNSSVSNSSLVTCQNGRHFYDYPFSCTSCGPGSKSMIPTTTCGLCIPGYFQEYSGESFCQACPVNTSMNPSLYGSNTSANCVPCSTDSHSSQGATECLPNHSSTGDSGSGNETNHKPSTKSPFSNFFFGAAFGSLLFCGFGISILFVRRYRESQDLSEQRRLAQRRLKQQNFQQPLLDEDNISNPHDDCLMDDNMMGIVPISSENSNISQEFEDEEDFITASDLSSDVPSISSKSNQEYVGF